MEPTTAVEKRHAPETALQRLGRLSGEFLSSLGRMAVLTAIFTPLLLLSFLTADLPMRAFDGLFGVDAGLRPSNWLSVGAFIMAFAPLAGILIARKYGGEEASRAVTASWGVAAIAVFTELSYLAPALEAGDMPPARFAVAFVASAMAAQYIAVNVYDVVRGGGRWWRAPLFSALGGYLVYGLVYFPGVMWGSGLPWLNWMVAGFAINVFLAACFLPFYAFLRKPLRPKGGYGGV